ncbi:C-GCAxxG-C-C family (seleno)protein [Clostridium sp. Ade.TY]|uniref:C-GCAxxG-C-C family (seleno)protein n=1 Tax=Clostridium sp. Ade.TY TaxID=1391647 RepID=UPI000413B7F8|nr:C-GCAxxG-C-C family (seleno)protein [Clostridium sp. Ade.TY]
MLIDKALKFWNMEHDLNCAECILYAANEEYNLGLNKDSFKMMASFGGGMGIGSSCGAATGAISVIGIMFTNERGHESPIVRELSADFMNRFYKKFESLNCIDIKHKREEDDRSCKFIIETAATILDDIVRENNR